jgi:hypothetical protein
MGYHTYLFHPSINQGHVFLPENFPKYTALLTETPEALHTAIGRNHVEIIGACAMPMASSIEDWYHRRFLTCETIISHHALKEKS